MSVYGTAVRNVVKRGCFKAKWLNTKQHGSTFMSRVAYYSRKLGNSDKEDPDNNENDVEIDLNPSLKAKTRITQPVGLFKTENQNFHDKKGKSDFTGAVSNSGNYGLSNQDKNNSVVRRKYQKKNEKTKHSFVYNQISVDNPFVDETPGSPYVKERRQSNDNFKMKTNNFASNSQGHRRFEQHSQDRDYQEQNLNVGIPNHGLSGKGTYKYKHSKALKSPFVSGEILFGIFPVLLALQRRKRLFNKLYIRTARLSAHNEGNKSAIDEIIRMAKEVGVIIEPCQGKVLTELSGDRPHQGVCLDVSCLHYQDFAVEKLEHATAKITLPTIWLYLEHVKDPMNFGAILRTAYYFGIDRIICTHRDSSGLSPVVSKASSGALELLDVYSTDNVDLLVKKMKEDNWTIVGTVGTGDGSSPLCEERIIDLQLLKLESNMLLMLGNEGSGLRSQSLQLCDTLVNISSRPDINTFVGSLNVSVATGILLHHIAAQRGK